MEDRRSCANVSIKKSSQALKTERTNQIGQMTCNQHQELGWRSLMWCNYLIQPILWRNEIKRVEEWQHQLKEEVTFMYKSMIQSKGPLHEMINYQSLPLRNLNVISTSICPSNYNLQFEVEWRQHIQEECVIHSYSFSYQSMKNLVKLPWIWGHDNNANMTFQFSIRQRLAPKDVNWSNVKTFS